MVSVWGGGLSLWRSACSHRYCVKVKDVLCPPPVSLVPTGHLRTVLLSVLAIQHQHGIIILFKLLWSWWSLWHRHVSKRLTSSAYTDKALVWLMEWSRRGLFLALSQDFHIQMSTLDHFVRIQRASSGEEPCPHLNEALGKVPGLPRSPNVIPQKRKEKSSKMSAKFRVHVR